MAVGLFRMASDGTAREAHLELALYATQEGYALAEAFSVEDGPLAGANLTAEDLAGRVDAQAVLVIGDVDRVRVEDLVERARLVVFYVDATKRSTSGSAHEGPG